MTLAAPIVMMEEIRAAERLSGEESR